MINLFPTWNGVRSKASFRDHLILLWSSHPLTFITVLGLATLIVHILDCINIFVLFSKYSDGTEDKDEDSKDAVEGNVNSSIYYSDLCTLHELLLLILCFCSLQNKVTTLLSLSIVKHVSQVSEYILRLIPCTYLFTHWNFQPLGNASLWCSRMYLIM